MPDSLVRPPEHGDLKINLFEADDDGAAFWSYSINGIGNSMLHHPDIEADAEQLNAVLWHAIRWARRSLDMEIDRWDLQESRRTFGPSWTYNLTFVDDSPVDNLNREIADTGFQFEKWRNSHAIRRAGKLVATLQRIIKRPNSAQYRHWRVYFPRVASQEFYKTTYAIHDCRGGAYAPAGNSGTVHALRLRLTQVK